MYVVLAAIILAGLFLMALMHAGYFSEIRIRTSLPLSLPGRVAYKLYRGSYSNAGAAFKELAAVAPHLKTVGIYYDDPNKVGIKLPALVHRVSLPMAACSVCVDGNVRVGLHPAGNELWPFVP